MVHLLLKQMKDSTTDLGIVTFVQYKNANSNIFYDLKKNIIFSLKDPVIQKFLSSKNTIYKLLIYFAKKSVPFSNDC